MPTNDYPNIGYIFSKDFSYYKKYAVTETTFGGNSVSGFQPVAVIPFVSRGVMLVNEGSGVVEFSFNGTTVHGELDSEGITPGIAFDNKVAARVWLRLKTGSSGPINVSIYAWAAV